MPDSAKETPAAEHDVLLVTLAFIMMAVSVFMLSFNLALTVKQVRQAEKDHRANCSYREYLKGQADSSSKYLAAHPLGIPSIGVSAGQLRAQIDRQRAAYNSLSDLGCG